MIEHCRDSLGLLIPLDVREALHWLRSNVAREQVRGLEDRAGEIQLSLRISPICSTFVFVLRRAK